MDGIFVGSREGANEGPASTETCKAPGVVEDGSKDVIEKDVVGSTVTEERKRLWPNSTSEVGAWAKPKAYPGFAAQSHGGGASKDGRSGRYTSGSLNSTAPPSHTNRNDAANRKGAVPGGLRRA
jgi:hypothetical protein